MDDTYVLALWGKLAIYIILRGFSGRKMGCFSRPLLVRDLRNGEICLRLQQDREGPNSQGQVYRARFNSLVGVPMKLVSLSI
jgi:hypothetical protein